MSVRNFRNNLKKKGYNFYVMREPNKEMGKLKQNNFGLCLNWCLQSNSTLLNIMHLKFEFSFWSLIQMKTHKTLLKIIVLNSNIQYLWFELKFIWNFINQFQLKFLTFNVNWKLNYSFESIVLFVSSLHLNM